MFSIQDSSRDCNVIHTHLVWEKKKKKDKDEFLFFLRNLFYK